MLFTGNSRFKENYLIAAIGSKMENTYKRYEYSVYDDLLAVYEERSVIEHDDIQKAVRGLREIIADSVFETVDREYNDSMHIAEEILKRYRDADTDGILTAGPSVALVYSIAIKMVMGDKFEFRVIEPVAVNTADLKNAEFFRLAGMMLSRFEELESETIRSSFEILLDDGLIRYYPDYI